MSQSSVHNVDISIVTRIRIKAGDKGMPFLRAVLNSLLVYGGISALHLLTAFVVLSNSASGQASALESLPLDDAWIHMVYAQSFADGFSFEYNPGESEAGVTSPLWIVLVGTAHKILGPQGIGLVTTAKALGIILSIGTSVIALRLVARITGNRVLGIATAAIVALDPVLSLDKVSGVESTLFGFLALGAAASFYMNRLALTGVLLALVVAARPEGVILVLLAGVALVLKSMWMQQGTALLSKKDFVVLLKISGPAIFIVLLMALYNISVNGTLYPNTYLAKHETMGLVPLSNVGNLIKGYLFNTSYFGGFGMLATMPLLALAWVVLTKSRGLTTSIPLILFPFALYYALSTILPLDPSPWTIETRRYLDPVLPFIAVGIVVGLNETWRLWHTWYATDYTSRISDVQTVASKVLIRLVGVSGNLGFLTLLVLPFGWAAFNWPLLTDEFSWNTRNGNDVNVGIARWVDENLPADSVIGATNTPGALRFFSNRYVVDLTGLNTHTAIGPPARMLTIAEEHGVDYIVGFRNIYFDSWPEGEEVFALKSDDDSIFTVRNLVVYEALWDREVEWSDKSVPYIVDVSDFRPLDSLDVGNEASEEAHIYSITQQGATVMRTFLITREEGEASVNIKDDARTSTGYEEFVVRSEVGVPLVVVRRYDAASGGLLNVYADDVLVGLWTLPAREFVFGEDTFRIPPEMITQTTTKLRFEYVATPNTILNSFYYWIYSPR